MRIVDEEKVENEPDPSQQQSEQSQQAPAQTAQGTHPADAETIDDVFPEGSDVIEGELPVGPPEAEPEQEGTEQPSEQQAESGDEPTDKGDTPTSEEEAGEGPETGVEQADDVNTSQVLDRVRKEAALDVEDEDELVQTVNQMQTNLRGTETFRKLAKEEVPELGEVVSAMLQNFDGEDLDATAFYMTLDETLPGVEVQAPSKNEDPDGYTDFQMRVRERRKEIQERRRKQQELQKKQKQIKQDYDQAWKSFKKRHDLGDEEAKEFKQWFTRTFYGDQEKGQLPRKDIFDMAYTHYADEDTPVEETDAYKEGYNAAIEEMKEGGASGDQTPNMISGGGGGDDSPPESTSEAEDVMRTMYSEEELSGEDNLHDQF